MRYIPTDICVAKKYAQAFLNLFFSQITSTDVQKIATAQLFLQNHRKSLFFVQLPQFTDAIRLSMIEDLIGYLSLPQECIKIFLLLIKENRSYLMPDVLFFIVSLYKERVNAVDFAVTTACPLDETQKNSINMFLGRIVHKNSSCTYAIDRTLIAGIRAQSVEYMWEYSVRKQLMRLRALEKTGMDR